MGKWIKGWASTLGKEVKVLESSGCFERAHNHDGGEMNVDEFCIPKFNAGTFVWSLSPSFARIVIKELS